MVPTVVNQEEKFAENLSLQEKQRAVYWDTRDAFVSLRMEWRASMARHLFHIIPGQEILEIAAGNGLFTEPFINVTRDQCKVTATVFLSEHQAEINKRIKGKNLEVIYLSSFPGQLKGRKFNYIIANHSLVHNLRDLFLSIVKSLLKPGGGLLLFEANPWNPYLRMRRALQAVFPFTSKGGVEPLSLDRLQALEILSEIGYTQIKAIPCDFLYPPVPKFLLWPVKNLSIILENFPYIRNFAGTLYIWARNPVVEGQEEYAVDLCEHQMLFNKVSFVIPCHNEEMNIVPLVEKLRLFYGRYINEIIIVDDNSKDRTAEIADKIANKYDFIRVIKRQPPNGVGFALQDGLNLANGEYIFMLDSDFKDIIPEMRDLFDAMAFGADAAVGSRFSPRSVMINYAFTKIIANRAFHLLASLLFKIRFRDVSNNLKIIRKEVAKSLIIESGDFAANAEIGLKLFLLGYKVVEVPISWVNRSIDMGFSTFKILKTGPNYNKILFNLLWRRIGKQPYQKNKIE